MRAGSSLIRASFGVPMGLGVRRAKISISVKLDTSRKSRAKLYVGPSYGVNLSLP